MKEYNNYKICPLTMALVSAKHPYYKTIIFDKEGSYLSTQKICLLFDEMKNDLSLPNEGEDFKSTGLEQRTYFFNKEENISSFQTVPVFSDLKIWIFPDHVSSIGNQERPKILFENGETLVLNCSKEDYFTERDSLLNQVNKYQIG